MNFDCFTRCPGRGAQLSGNFTEAGTFTQRSFGTPSKVTAVVALEANPGPEDVVSAAAEAAAANRRASRRVRVASSSGAPLPWATAFVVVAIQVGALTWRFLLAPPSFRVARLGELAWRAPHMAEVEAAIVSYATVSTVLYVVDVHLSRCVMYASCLDAPKLSSDPIQSNPSPKVYFCLEDDDQITEHSHKN